MTLLSKVPRYAPERQAFIHDVAYVHIAKRRRDACGTNSGQLEHPCKHWAKALETDVPPPIRPPHLCADSLPLLIMDHRARLGPRK